MIGEKPGQPSSTSAGWLAILLATVGGNFFLVFGTLVCGTIAILVSWIPPHGNHVFHVARIWSRGLLAFSGIRLERSFEIDLGSNPHFVFMANHQSLYDIPSLIATLPVQTRFLAKKSLFSIPIFGWAIKAGGFISIDRQDRSRAGESFAAAVQRIRAGVSALVFPEGTRSLDAQLGPFLRGGFLLALKSGLPIVPVGIHGSFSVQPKGSHLVRPGRIRVRYGKPIRVADFGLRRRRELEDAVREEITRLAMNGKM